MKHLYEFRKIAYNKDAKESVSKVLLVEARTTSCDECRREIV